MDECVKKMPKECRDLYKKFIILRKETNSLKNNLTDLTNNKKAGGLILPKNH